MTKYDILIRNAQIVDGTGQAAYTGDVGVIGERIAWTGRGGEPATQPEETARRVIDARGMVLSPGFVDMHGHSDYTLLIDHRAESKLRQGVTTEVVGNCGYSAAPMYSPLLEERKPEYEGLYGLALTWHSFPEYLTMVEASAPSLNYVFLIGHNTLRASCMGFGDQMPSSGQMARMEAWVDEALACGAFGLSSGLFYAPACFAKKEELIGLASRVSQAGGILTTHIRNEGDGLLEALYEILIIARESRVSLQISHLKTFGRENWGKLDHALALIESVRQQGVDVTFDRYPYLAVQTSLQSLLPDWAQSGGSEAIVQRLSDPSVRRELIQQLLTRHPEEDYGASIFISLVAGEAHKDREGLNLAQIADYQKVSWAEAALDLLRDERTQVEIIQFAMSEHNLARILQHPLAMIGSDSSSRAATGPLRIGKPHPRAFGTFSRVIGEFWREKHILTLEEAVRKMTALPCQKLGIPDRGLIREGMTADLVLFDPACIADQATYQDPFRYPTGIRLVMINGRICLEEDGSILPGQGRVLRRR
ncbi:MAG: D-aminoacylase [bacterium]